VVKKKKKKKKKKKNLLKNYLLQVETSLSPGWN
jgi:hypothetical protein